MGRLDAYWVGLMLATSGCYSGLEADGVALDTDAAQTTGASTDDGDDVDGESTGSEPLDPELGDCDPDALASSTLRRLNRREYRNTIADLFGLPAFPDVALPWDDLNTRGFDNDGSSLSLDTIGAEQYFDAAVAVASNFEGAGVPPLGECAALAEDGLVDCVESGAQAWLERAFRRPVDEQTVERMMSFVRGAQSYPDARDAIITFTLTSPLFLFHYKPAPQDEPSDAAYLVADRLAYLLWSSGPDAALLDAARDGALLDDGRLEAEVERMVADPRSARFFEDFAHLWLQLGILNLKPDAEINAELFADMQTETRAFFEFAARENLPLSTLLAGNESYVNGRLADHYGIDGPVGDDEWAWVELPPERRGLLTQGAVLVASSGDTFSDPIRRGAWIAEHIVCQEPPLPEGGIPDLPTPPSDEPVTIRELLEEHRQNPACAGCHALMDPYGLALENYDRLGLHRTAYDNGLAIDPSGVLPGGAEFDDAIGMVDAMTQGESFEHCAAEYLTAYSVGRALGEDEECFVELVLDKARDTDEAFGLRDVLAALATSYIFVNGGQP
ncbi:MAG: DUF1592 domain-containing protein [Nannocystaceae bacterium]|nr:DUF1592 domain-containing protein [Nannocystaceae bacterium]